MTEIETATGLNNTTANRCISELVKARLLELRLATSKHKRSVSIYNTTQRGQRFLRLMRDIVRGLGKRKF